MKKLAFTIFILLCVVISAQAQILYKVSGNGLEKPSYLFGTHHLAPLSVFTENADAIEAFASAGQIVGEIDIKGNPLQVSAKMTPYMLAPIDSTLSKVIPSEQYAEADSLLQEILKTPEITLKTFEIFKPAVLTQQITVTIIIQNMPGYKAEEQLDYYFQLLGIEEGKKILAFETVEQQAEILFRSQSIQSQAEELLGILANPQDLVLEAQKLNNAYLAQDIDAMFQMAIAEDIDPDFFEKLTTQRNNNWIQQLPEIMKADSTFVAVGCLHLAGETGLVQQLRNLGYTVEAYLPKHQTN